MISIRSATAKDIDGIVMLIDDANRTILPRYFNEASVVEASRAIMSLDRSLIEDGTYYVAEESGHLLGCGGWSRRSTLYGGDETSGRDATLLDPGTQAAKIRGMYTHPDHLRRGIGRMILHVAEAAAMREGFRRTEMGATLAGVPLYLALGYREVEPIEHEVAGVRVPLVRMTRDLTP